ncbi:GNAT family N-acetyltransferase [Caproicibacter sp.]|uniref:GNAT family N-acetyltransferase n=1 Tax=Caproicibacter sp. TaxID=2814884 RepID=UPI0039899227
MKIRKAGPEDVESVYELICSLEESYPPHDAFRQTYLNNLKSPGILYLLCEHQGRAAAFGSLHIQLLLHHCGAAAEIQELVVQPDLRGNGIGAALVSALKEEALRRGCVLLEVCCNRKREHAHRFYESCGMRRSHFKFTMNL